MCGLPWTVHFVHLLSILERRVEKKQGAAKVDVFEEDTLV